MILSSPSLFPCERPQPLSSPLQFSERLLFWITPGFGLTTRNTDELACSPVGSAGRTSIDSAERLGLIANTYQTRGTRHPCVRLRMSLDMIISRGACIIGAGICFHHMWRQEEPIVERDEVYFPGQREACYLNTKASKK